MTMACDHSGTHSGQARYLRDVGQLRLLLVCDGCEAECAELERIDYRPDARGVDGRLAELTARELGLSEFKIARVRLAMLLCDIGRDQIPPEILNKQGPLNDREWAEIRRQPEFGAALLSDVSFDDIREWILNHHERPDGRGYPRGLVGDQIPLEARIVAVVDAYTAMTSERPYRSARDHQEACRELWRCAGSQFDAAVVQAFLSASLGRARHPARAAA
jgi:HD-GYP domain-containing protein (c-di-GMP phosphodiesterase class II)